MSEHVVPARTYVLVCVCLLILTGVTVALAHVNLSALNTPLALLIAALKAMLIALFFMHLRWSGGMPRLVGVAALLWLSIMIVGTLDDVLTRDWLTILSK